jgi:hypothetical protein
MIASLKPLPTLPWLLLGVALLIGGKGGWAQNHYYIPKSLIIPVHTQKQELHVSLGSGGGYEANVSYALANHLAVFTSGTFKKGTIRRSGLTGDRLKYHKDDYVLKGGIGYFRATNHSFINFVESYLGVGNYKVDNYRYFVDQISLGESFTQARFWNAFWQVQATNKTPKSERTAALRLSYSRYSDLQFWDNHPNVRFIKSRYEGLWGVSLDPVVGYSYLLHGFKLNLQAGLSIPLTWVQVAEIDTFVYPNQPTEMRPDNGITKMGLGTVLGKISIQRNFVFTRKAVL